MAKFPRRIYLGLLFVASAAAINRMELDRSMVHLNFAKPRWFFFSISRKNRTIYWSELCHAAAFFVTRSLLRIITRVHIDVAMTYRALVSTNTGGAPKNFEGDFLGFRKSTFRPFSKNSSSDGFYPIGSKFGTKMAKHVFSKTCLRFSIFALKPEISQHASKTARHFTNLAFKLEYLPNATKNQNSETPFLR